ncbi:RTA-like protein [Penicillium griseofulvum]|uniref:RTA-like protein n=1 Tax=Penicillium patulum TaxID=5078 RepID=A0A135LXV6_PENPA|nr:RTA-like protein [Penicillium griseofulvum]KXG53751.1 RTA-like protein [Penicillium griseofulvum]
MMARASPVQTAAPQPEVFPRDATPTTATNPETTTATTTKDDFRFGFTLETLNLHLPTSTCTPTIAPDKYGWVPPSECDALYLYYPSFGAAIAASVIFGILTIAHLVQAIMYKAGFVWVVLMGVVWELVAYTTRAFSTRNQQNEPVTTSSLMFILLAPLWVNAFDYMVLARMIHFFVPDRRISMFKPSLLAKIFVVLDIFSFIVQMIGGFMANNKGKQQMDGIHIYMGGIGIQELFILGFLVLAVQFHRLMLQLERSGRLPSEKQNWRGLLYALYGSLVAITVRIIYRLVEFSAGTEESNPIPYHEWYMYVFDAIPMVLAIGVWNFAPPGAVLQGPDAKMPPSGIGKWLCCNGCACCCGSCRKGNGEKNMQRLPDQDVYDDNIPLHSREPSPYRDTYTTHR